MALVVLSVVEQRLDAVRAVLAGATVTEVADQDLGLLNAIGHRPIQVEVLSADEHDRRNTQPLRRVNPLSSGQRCETFFNSPRHL